mmetsp:Transcript_13926/g.26101  ORF Transcript_13926/g.26101 Transcript_13926/m.26101 type:complete len:831 (+) Transcript_13926:274-2766(+)
MTRVSDAKVTSPLGPSFDKANLLKAVHDPVNSLIKANNLDILQRAVECGAIKLKKKEVLILLRHRHVKLVLQCLLKVTHSSLSTHPLLKHFNTLTEVCKLFNNVEHIPDAIQILGKVKQTDLHALHLHAIIVYSTELLYPKPGESKLSLSKCPLSLCVAMSDFLELIRGYKSEFTTEIDKLKNAYTKVAEAIVFDIKDRKLFKDVMSFKPFGVYHLFDIICANSAKYRSILNTPQMKELTSEYWTQNLPLHYGFGGSSYVVKAVDRCRAPNKLWKVHQKKLEQRTVSVFQYTSWLNNCNIRHSVETTSWVVETVLIFYCLIRYLDIRQFLMAAANYTAEEIQEKTDVFDSINEITDNVVFPFGLMNGLYAVVKLFYKYKLHFRYSHDFRLLFDLTIFVSCFIINFRMLGSLESQLKPGSTALYEYFWGALIFAVTFRTLINFAVEEKFGPIIRMLISTFLDTIRFLLIFAMILVCFSMTFYNLFYGAKGYSSFSDSLLTLFAAALGQFDFYVFTQREELGKLMLALWIVISTILILNILIAVLSSRYNKLAPQASADYINILLTNIRTTVFTPEYGGLVVFPLPFTLVLAPFIPLYFLPIKKAKLTLYLSYLSYAPMFLVGMVTFSVCNAIFSLKAFFLIACMFASNSSIGATRKVVTVARWVCVGPWYLGYLTCISIPVFARFLFAEDKYSQEDLLITAKDQEGALKLLRQYQEKNPSAFEIPLNEALKLKLGMPKKFSSLAVRIVAERTSFLSPDDVVERYTVSKEKKEYDSNDSFKCIVKALASYSTGTLPLKHSIHLLETLPTEHLSVMSRYSTEKALASLEMPSH